MVTGQVDFANIDAGVSTYERRHLSVLPVATIGGRQLKRYLITVDGGPVDPDIVAAADDYLPRLLPADDDGTPSGFVVLHVAASGVWLNVYTWVWDNVIHARFAEASKDAPTVFADMTVPWIGCVWELAPFAHERTAWVTHMRRPETADLNAYLGDTMAEGWFD